MSGTVWVPSKTSENPMPSSLIDLELLSKQEVKTETELLICTVSFEGNGNILKLVVMIAQPVEYTTIQ
jgi:hypothetical protein